MGSNRIFDVRQADEIRDRYFSGGVSMADLARKYFCSRTTVWRVVNYVGAYAPDDATAPTVLGLSRYSARKLKEDE